MTRRSPPTTAVRPAWSFPGWCGCACIKWVDRIERVADDAPATSQMLEFAARTHQPFDPAAVAASLREGPTTRALSRREIFFLP